MIEKFVLAGFLVLLRPIYGSTILKLFSETAKGFRCSSPGNIVSCLNMSTRDPPPTTSTGLDVELPHTLSFNLLATMLLASGSL